jgi:hypothetical protein
MAGSVAQNRAFLLYPPHLPPPAVPLIGAESLHHLFTTWLTAPTPTPAPNPTMRHTRA